MSIRRSIELLLLLSSVGCVSFQDCRYQAAQNHRARCAWLFNCEERCSSNYWSHYSYGWRRGYADVLMGGDGRCPPVPPQNYWDAKYQTESGEEKIESWFQGYRDGSAAAFACCGDQFNPVPMSNETRMCLPGCLPSDRAAYRFGKTTLEMSVQHPQTREDSTTPKSYDAPDAPASPGKDEDPAKPAPSPDEAASLNESDAPPAPMTAKDSPVFRGNSRAIKRQSNSAVMTTRLSNSGLRIFRRGSNSSGETD